MAVSEQPVAKLSAPTARVDLLPIHRAEERSLAGMAFRRFLTIRSAVVGAAILLVLILAAVFAPLLTDYDYAKIAPTEAYASPSAEHPMGTDKFGRDVFTRVLYGGRISLTVGLIAVAIGATATLGGWSTRRRCASSTSCWPFLASCWRWGLSPCSAPACKT
jgi:peptide/nickel transport system permease protein